MPPDSNATVNKSTDLSGSGNGISPTGTTHLPSELQPLAGAIQKASAATGVPADLLGAVAWDESRGVLNATSTNQGTGLSDVGVMQVDPATFSDLQSKHPELAGKSLSNPDDNMMAAAFLLKDMKQQFGSWALALRGYNSGALSVDKSNPNITTTGYGDPSYISKVGLNLAAIDNGTQLPA